VVALAPVLLLQRALVYTHLIEAARTDSKTGLANPAHWRSEAGRAVARAQRVGLALSILVVDLDRFKAINDHYGHLAGDAVLTAVADTLRLRVRPGDLVARFGGEEFTVLLVGANRQTGAAIGERIRDHLAKMSCPLPGGTHRVNVTASVGLAVWGEDGLDLEALLGAADTAMYQAKAAGGNRLCLALGELTPLVHTEVDSKPAVS
jgi:diguanylate cyclase (GGDEF)-like protein